MKFDREVDFILNPNCSRLRGQPDHQGVMPDQFKTGGRHPNFFPEICQAALLSPPFYASMHVQLLHGETQ
jgi:hypothetical protein